MDTVQLELSGGNLAQVAQPDHQQGIATGIWAAEALRHHTQPWDNPLAGIGLPDWSSPDAPQRPLRSNADLEAFWRWCDARHGPDPAPEPDWDDHLRAINASRQRGLPGV